MTSTAREIVGFLCRWCLLGLAAVAILAGAYAGLLAVADVKGDLRAGVALSDFLCRADKETEAEECLTWPASEAELLLSATDGGRLRQDVVYHGRPITFVPPEPAGRHTLELRGIPYGPLAFYRGQSLLMMTPAQTPVYLVDAGMISRSLESGAADFRSALSQMYRWGEVAFFVAGDVDQFVAEAREARYRWPGTPVVWSPPLGGKEYRTLRNVAYTLGRGRAESMAVVTDRPDFAKSASRQGFQVLLVAPAGDEVQDGRLLRRFDSLFMLKAHLLARPIM